jgi:hypothetical protein
MRNALLKSLSQESSVATGLANHRKGRPSEAGFTFLLALFMVVAITVGAEVVLQNMATEGRRQREQEVVWRGNQWVRAIRMYYRKTGHYPQTADDLEMGLPDLHFLRPAAYKDPMNPDDSWRFIYTSGNGQLIGSVRYATLQQMAIIDLLGAMPTAGQEGSDSGAGASSSTSSSTSGSTSSSTPPSASGGTGSDNSGDTANGGGQNSQQGGNSPSSTGPQPPGGSQAQAPGGSNGLLGNTLGGGAAGLSQAAVLQLQPTGAVDGPVLGGFLTGVASKVERPSIRFYHGGKTYKEWEFIWNPVEDQAQAIAQGLGNGQGVAPGQPGQPAGPGTGIGTGTGTGTGTGNTPNQPPSAPSTQ